MLSLYCHSFVQDMNFPQKTWSSIIISLAVTVVTTMNISRMVATTNFTCKTGFLRVYFLDYKNNAEYPSDDRSPCMRKCAREWLSTQMCLCSCYDCYESLRTRLVITIIFLTCYQFLTSQSSYITYRILRSRKITRYENFEQ